MWLSITTTIVPISSIMDIVILSIMGLILFYDLFYFNFYHKCLCMFNGILNNCPRFNVKLVYSIYFLISWKIFSIYMNLFGEVKGTSYDFVGFVDFLELDILANCSPCHYPIAMEGMLNGGLYVCIWCMVSTIDFLNFSFIYSHYSFVFDLWTPILLSLYFK